MEGIAAPSRGPRPTVGRLPVSCRDATRVGTHLSPAWPCPGDVVDCCALLPAGHPPLWDPGAEEGHGVVRVLRGALPCAPGPAEPSPGGGAEGHLQHQRLAVSTRDVAPRRRRHRLPLPLPVPGSQGAGDVVGTLGSRPGESQPSRSFLLDRAGGGEAQHREATLVSPLGMRPAPPDPRTTHPGLQLGAPHPCGCLQGTGPAAPRFLLSLRGPGGPEVRKPTLAQLPSRAPRINPLTPLRACVCAHASSLPPAPQQTGRSPGVWQRGLLS